MERKYIIILIIFLSLAALGFVFIRGDRNVFSGISALNLDSIFSRNKDDGAGGSEENIKYGYILDTPQDFISNTNKEEDIEITTYEKSETEGFQVFVTPFDEEGPITPERILLDVDIEINNPAYYSLDGEEALAFNSSAEGLGKTFEIWVVHNGYLYQVMTYGSFEARLLEILGSWKFK